MVGTIKIQAMKKSIFICVLMLCIGIVAGLSGCSSCGKEKQEVKTDTLTTFNVEEVTAVDREYMSQNFAHDYSWFETCITMTEYLDEESQGVVEQICNIFQVVEDSGRSFDAHVIFVEHAFGETNVRDEHGFWTEDKPLIEAEIVLTFTEAFEKVMQVNYPKPHSKQCVLRKPLGSRPCSAQYVFGNTRNQLFVDAVTGEVRNTSPAFGE